MNKRVMRSLLGIAAVCILAACGTSLPADEEAGRHLVPPEAPEFDEIPDVVRPLTLLPAPQAQEAPELYSVVVQDVSVRELLFALARDANVNIDVHPQVIGLVSLNAIDQTLPQILDRIGRQIDMRWSMDAVNGLMVEMDSPYFQTYRVDYVNVAREADTGFSVSTALSSVGGGASGATGTNNSLATLSQSSSNNFWVTLEANLLAILGDGGDSAIVSNPESGIINVRASSRQHREIQSFLDYVKTRSLYQVLIEATVVEVSLNDNYQAGVDWATLSRDSGQVNFLQSVTGLNVSDAPASMLTIDKSAGPDAISATMRMLSKFGDLRVLSSPKIMALNNRYLGMVRQWQEIEYSGRYSHSYMDALPNFVKLAEAYGHVGMLIERPEDVEPALREARKLKDRTVFMDFRTDPTENVFPMVQAGKGITEMLLSPEDL